MKPASLTMLILAAAITLAQEIEPPRILGARIDRTRAEQGIIVAELFIFRHDLQPIQVQQISDGTTNKLVHVSDEVNKPISWTVKLGGETNVFRVRSISHHVPPIFTDWSLPYTVIPTPRE